MAVDAQFFHVPVHGEEPPGEAQLLQELDRLLTAEIIAGVDVGTLAIGLDAVLVRHERTRGWFLS